MPQVEPKLVIAAYRRLFKAGLRAVRFSVPARYVVRDQLRKAFRGGASDNYDQVKINNTVGFLDQASKATGIEHKMLKNIIHVRYCEREQIRATAGLGRRGRSKVASNNGPISWMSQERKDGYRAFDNALKIFNDNHQLYLG